MVSYCPSCGTRVYTDSERAEMIASGARIPKEVHSSICSLANWPKCTKCGARLQMANSPMVKDVLCPACGAPNVLP